MSSPTTKSPGCSTFVAFLLLIIGVLSVRNCLCGPIQLGEPPPQAPPVSAEAAAQAKKEKELADEIQKSSIAYEQMMDKKARTISIQPYAFVSQDGNLIQFTVTNKYTADQDGLGVRCGFFRETDGLQVDEKTFSLNRLFPKGKTVKTKPQSTSVFREYKTVTCSLLFAYDATK